MENSGHLGGHHHHHQVRKVITAPSLKRGKDETPINERQDNLELQDAMGVAPRPTRDKENVPAYQVKLERVLGLTVSSNSGLDCDPNSELVAYPAGCTVVLLDPVKGGQSHIVNTTRKTITCVGFSGDGRYLATGECGQSPSLRLWDLMEGTLIAELTGHKYYINCLAFSPSQKYIVSVGSQHDMIVNVWDWRSGVKVASNKVSTKVKAISFAENGTYFVTVGNRHVKFWYLEYSRGAKYKEPVPLMGRSAILGEQRNNDFVDVACGRGEMGDSTYAITRSGLLCEFNNRRLLDKWVELRTSSANCMALGEYRIFIGCADGIVRCFDPRTLQFITTLPRTHYLGVDVAQGLDISHMASHPSNAKYPDAIAVTYDERHNKLTCVYNDHSLYIWDVRDIKRVGKSHSYLYHSACIWGVEMFPEGSHGQLPPGSFVTCSSDDTIRVWNIDSQCKTQPGSTYQRNIYSKELLKIIYVDPDLNFLKDVGLTGAERVDNSIVYDGKNGVRSIRMSPDGKHLASGDRTGNIRVHDIATLQELCLIEAHDAEVLCLEYSRYNPDGHKLLASASRDRLVHVFDVKEDYNFVQTLDDHSSSITAVRFLNMQENLQMVSCGADKSIIFRQLSTNSGSGSGGGGSSSGVQFTRVYNAAGKTTLYDMEVDFSQKHVLTACQDRNIRVYNVSSGKHTKTFKGSVSEEGSLIKVALDSSGIFVATSCTDKTLCIYDYYSGECMATMAGHSELVTGLKFTDDCGHLVSASGDGCVLVWTVPHDMVVTMRARLSQQAARNRKPVKLTNGIINDNEEFGPPPIEMMDPNANSQSDYRFSFGQLPVWAKKELDGVDIGSGGPRVSGPKGRWAQRIDQTGIGLKSVYDSDPIIPFSPTRDKRHDSDGSKEDSSIDSGAETGRSLLSTSRREIKSITKASRDTSIDFLTCPESLQEILDSDNNKTLAGGGKVTMTRGGSDIQEHHGNKHHTDDSSLGSFKYEDIESTEHDGDVEDYSEGESSDTRRPLYMPQHEEPNREYPITNMDAGELRKSMRRSKRPDLLMVTSEMSSASRSMSGSQSDEDELATTPTSEHNIILSASSDTLDVLAHREKFLKNTFESLSGTEEPPSATKIGKRSLSSQHHVSQVGTIRNATVIEATKHSKNDIEALRKREELQRRIEETRRKLQSVGYRSNLKSSQSIQDLSPRSGYSESRPKPMPRHRAVQQGKEIDSSTFTRKPKPSTTTCATNNTNQRPVSLNLSQLTMSPYKSGCKSMNSSLNVSPVCDNYSPTKSFTDAEVSMSYEAHGSRVKRYSCSFYVNINETSVNVGKESKSCDDLNEIYTLRQDSLGDNKSDIGSEYSSDSLEECSDFVAKPRRCISEYQILERSSSAFGFKSSAQIEKTKFHSEENILADDCNDGWERHSSASFFLRGKETCRSTESMLTDESEYQFLFGNKEVFRSTESILTDMDDLKELPEDLPSEVPQKQVVVRTRSLQDTAGGNIANAHQGSKSRPETPFAIVQKEWTCEIKESSKIKVKNESFFIPLGEGPEKPKLPEALLKKYQNREDKKGDGGHPVVAHKPPKPKPPVRSRTTKKVTKALPCIDTSGDRPPPVIKKEIWEAPVKDPGLESTPCDQPTNLGGGRVKLLSRNFERMCATCPREDFSCESGSSTPGTSSSCANSPKRRWKPGGVGYHLLTRRIANGPMLPDKCQPSVEEELGGGIRRACSLSDLTSPSPAKPRNSVQVSGKVNNLNSKTLTAPRHGAAKSSPMTRSSSVGVLNQSDSESEVSQVTSQRSLVSQRIMRPTISSQNKIASNTSKSNIQLRRRGLSTAFSTMSLNQGGNTEDSSSEENQSSAQNVKPAPPPRPKSASIDRPSGRRIGRSGSERELNKVGGSKVQRSSSALIRPPPMEASPFEIPVKDTDSVDITRAPLSDKLIVSMADELKRITDMAVELHGRLRSQPAIDQAQRDTLAGAIGEAHRKLQLINRDNS